MSDTTPSRKRPRTEEPGDAEAPEPPRRPNWTTLDEGQVPEAREGEVEATRGESHAEGEEEGEDIDEDEEEEDEDEDSNADSNSDLKADPEVDSKMDSNTHLGAHSNTDSDAKPEANSDSGCPTIELTDSANDLRHILRVFLPNRDLAPYFYENPSFDRALASHVRIQRQKSVSTRGGAYARRCLLASAHGRCACPRPDLQPQEYRRCAHGPIVI